MKYTDIAKLLNDEYSYRTVTNEDGVEEIVQIAVLEQDLSNIADFGHTITNGTTFENLFMNTFGNIMDKVGRTVFVDTEYYATAPKIFRDSEGWSELVEVVRLDVKDFVSNDKWSGLNIKDAEQETNSFEKMFGAELPTLTAKYFNRKIGYENKITITADQFKNAFTSANEMSKFFANVMQRLNEKWEFAKTVLIYNTFASAIIETSQLRPSIINSLSFANPDTLTDEDVKEIIIDIKDKLRSLREYSNAYKAEDFVTSVGENHLRLAISSKLYDRITLVNADVFHPEFLSIPMSNVDVLPYFQRSAHANSVTGITPTTPEGKYTSVDGLAYVIYDDRLCGCTADHYTTVSIPVQNKHMTNYFPQADTNMIVNTDFACAVTTYSNGGVSQHDITDTDTE